MIKKEQKKKKNSCIPISFPVYPFHAFFYFSFSLSTVTKKKKKKNRIKISVYNLSVWILMPTVNNSLKAYLMQWYLKMHAFLFNSNYIYSLLTWKTMNLRGNGAGINLKLYKKGKKKEKVNLFFFNLCISIWCLEFCPETIFWNWNC